MRTDLATGTVTTESTQQFDGTLNMTVSEDAMAHIAFAFSNIYNDPTLAVIREYIANAIDATRGNGGEIEIIAPTYERPTFVVRDFGTGMSFDTVSKVFRGYFESSKNTSSTEIGGWGIGAKSALAIADQFTVSTTQDGETVRMVITKSDVGLPKIQYNRVNTPDKSNGTAISVPVEVDNVANFRVKLRGFLWVLNTGNITKIHNLDDFDDNSRADDSEAAFTAKISDDTHVVIHEKGHVPAGFYLRMGGMYYESDLYNEMNHHLDTNLGNTLSALRNMIVIVDIPIDSVDLAPNREGIRFTSRTKDYLEVLVTELNDTLTDMFETFIQDAPSYDVALSRFEAFRYSYSANIPTTWCGITLMNNNFGAKGYKVITYHSFNNILSKKVRGFNPRGYSYSSLNRKKIVFIAVDAEDAAKGHHSYIREYITDSNENSTKFTEFQEYLIFVYCKDDEPEESDELSYRHSSQDIGLNDLRKVVEGLEVEEMEFSDIVKRVKEVRKARNKSKSTGRNSAQENRLDRVVRVQNGPTHTERSRSSVRNLVDRKNVIRLTFSINLSKAYEMLSHVLDDLVLVDFDAKIDFTAMSKEVPGFRDIDVEEFLNLTNNNKKGVTKTEIKQVISAAIHRMLTRIGFPEDNVANLKDPILKNSVKNSEKNYHVVDLLKIRENYVAECSEDVQDLVSIYNYPQYELSKVSLIAGKHGITGLDKIEDRTKMLHFLSLNNHQTDRMSWEDITNYINVDYQSYKKGKTQ